MTDEQREAALKAIDGVIWGSCPLASESRASSRALDALLTLGWRAPGPPTEAEVAAAARRMAAAVGVEWKDMLYSGRHHYLHLARAVLAPGEMKEETNRPEGEGK